MRVWPLQLCRCQLPLRLPPAAQLNPCGSSDACLPCGCFTGGTVNNTMVCDAITGQCPCQTQARGRDCSECQMGFYGLTASSSSSCQACDCSTTGSVATTVGQCEQSSGQCACKPGATGRQCDGEVQPCVWVSTARFSSWCSVRRAFSGPLGRPWACVRRAIKTAPRALGREPTRSGLADAAESLKANLP